MHIIYPREYMLSESVRTTKKNRDERMERERGLSKIKPPIIISTKGSVSRRQIDLSAISIKLKIVDINQ